MSVTGTNPQELFEQSGISREEQTEVLAHIDRVATENRIQTTPDLFSLKDVRSGILFPALVDGAAIVIIAVAVLALVFHFHHSEQRMVESSGTFTTVEGQLIRALQRESEQRLLEKDQQIASVRKQLAEVERQRRELTANVGAQVRQRETVYRQKIEQEVAAERERLAKQGISGDVGGRMLAGYEAERKAFYDGQLAQYRRQLEDERAAAEQQLSRLQVEYAAQIRSLGEERGQLVIQYKHREDELQQQLEQRTRVLDLARVEAIQNLATAQSRIQQLSRTQRQTSIVQDQILGQFEHIRKSLQSDDAQAALSGIDDLRSYLMDARVASITEISRQRQMDLFLLDSLQRLLQSQQRASSSLTNLSDDLVVISKIRETAAEAAQAQKEGDAAKADALYSQLIAYLPVVAKAHTALLAAARERALRSAAENAAKTQRERRVRFEELSTQATAAIRMGNYDRAFEDYRRALGLDPAVGDSGPQTAGELTRLGFVLSAFVGRSGENPRAVAAIREAGIDRAAQDTAFIAQAQRTANEQERLLLDRQKRLSEEIQGLNAEKASLQQRAAAERSALNGRIRANEREIAALKARVARLSGFESRIAALSTAYHAYTQGEEKALSGGGPNALLDARLALEGFVSTPEMARLFPDLGRRLRGYDSAFQSAGRKSAFQDASEILQTLSGFQTADQQRAYLDAQIARPAIDASYREFLTALRGYVR